MQACAGVADCTGEPGLERCVDVLILQRDAPVPGFEGRFDYAAIGNVTNRAARKARPG